MLLLTSSTTKDTGYNLRRAKWMLSGGCALEVVLVLGATEKLPRQETSRRKSSSLDILSVYR